MIAQRAQLHISLLDDSGTISHMSLRLKDGATVSTAASAAASFRGLAAACMDVVFVRQSITFSAVAAPIGAIGPTADCTRVGEFIFSDNATDFCIVELDGIKDSELISTGPGAGILIDQANPAIADLVTERLSGFWCSPFGYPLLTLESAYLHIRR